MRPIPPVPGEGVVVLMSGGVDSLVCAKLAHDAGVLRGLVYVRYGQPSANREANKSKRTAGRMFPGVDRVEVTVHGLHLAKMARPDDGPCVVPGRNTVLLALAANHAVRLGVPWVYIGCNQEDHDAYPDCRREAVWSMMDALSKSCGVVCRAPLGDLTKAQVIAEARRMGIERRDTWCCYLPDNMEPCGRCASCTEAAEAWNLTRTTPETP